jgi:biotin carboxyl carrier protein
VAVPVAVGDRVAPGAVLVVLRAMKLEHRVTAPRAGSVLEVLVREGEQVAFRQVVLRLAVAEEGAAAETSPQQTAAAPRGPIT